MATNEETKNALDAELAELEREMTEDTDAKSSAATFIDKAVSKIAQLESAATTEGLDATEILARLATLRQGLSDRTDSLSTAVAAGSTSL
jgi:hypothetical protein